MSALIFLASRSFLTSPSRTFLFSCGFVGDFFVAGAEHDVERVAFVFVAALGEGARAATRLVFFPLVVRPNFPFPVLFGVCRRRFGFSLSPLFASSAGFGQSSKA